MNNTTKDVLKAERNQYSNDLFWNCWTSSDWKRGKYIAGEKLEWSGYNDKYWWDNVATDWRFTHQTDSKGRTWELNPKTNEVTRIKL